MGRESSRDKDGDQAAAWRDLVTRLELPSPVDPASAPWPDRENLHRAVGPGATGPAATGPAATGAGTTGAGTTGAAATDQPGAAAGQPESRATSETPVSRSRVIRPANFMRSSDPAESSRAAGRSGQTPPAKPSKPIPPISPSPPERTATGDEYLDQPTNPDLGFIDFDDWADDDLDDPDNRYIPPPLPPLPKLDPVAKGAWTALFCGPGYLLLATILGWQIPGWAELAAVAAFVAGFVVLISRLGDGPSRRDGPDQGAVV